MSGDWLSWFWKSSIALALGGATVPCWSSIVLAQQIIADETLGEESSVVTPDNIKGLESDRISGGAVRGSNLFHSFREFNIGEGKGGYFENPAAIENIFSRVTGSNPSEILGTLGVLGNANLFFLNPNGILFGPNASLDVRGSFLGTTANSIVFPDGKQFSATNPEAAPLLTVNVRQPIGLQFEGREGVISHQGLLAVDAGQNLALVGGDITLDGGSLIAPGGRVELGGLLAAGEIGLSDDGSLSFPDGVARADVSLTNEAEVNVLAGGGGFVTVNAKNLELKEGSQLLAGIEEEIKSPGAVAGDIKINATDKISIEREKADSEFTDEIANQVGENGMGNSGNILITTDSLEVTNGAGLSTVTFGEGNAGSINITASDIVLLDGEASPEDSTSVFSRVEEGAKGNAGDVLITTGSLEVTNGALVSASTSGQGNAGSVTITASDNVLLDGEDSEGEGSGVFSQVGSKGKGNARSVSITTGSLEVTNGAELSVSTLGEGNAGSLTITARERVLFDGEASKESSFGLLNSGAFSLVASGARGNGGNISITTGSLEVTNGAQLAASTDGEGDAGTITVEAKDYVVFDGVGRRFISGAFSTANPGASGDAGTLTISTSKLLLNDGATVSVNNFGSGKGGNLTVNARESVQLTRRSGQFFSSLAAVAAGTGDAGNLTITTRQLLADGGQVQATTFGSGKGGNLTVNATESVQLIGFVQTPSGQFFPSGLFTSTQGLGDAGDLSIATKVLLVKDGSEVQASSTFGSGKGGNLTVNATESVQLIGSADNGKFGGLFTQTRGAGKAGDMKIVTEQLLVQDGSNVSAVTADDGGGSITVKANTLEITSGGQLRTTTEGIADAGNIALFVPDRITLSGADSAIFANTLEESSGDGGNIIIDPNTVIIRDGAQIAVNSEGSGVGGDIDLQAGSLTLNRGTITAETASNRGGNINLTLEDLLTLRNNSQITATAGTDEAEGDGGNITIDAPFIIAFPNEDSNIQADAFEGNGGNITINTNGIFGIEFRDEPTPLSDITASSEFGQQGEVEINTSTRHGNG